MNREEWLKERQTGVGASDAPNLVGVGFRDAASVYRSKVEPVRDTPPAGFLRRGLELEGIVANMYTEVMGESLTEPTEAIRRHPERPWQLASIDRERQDGMPVQLKTLAGFGDEWGENGTDLIPDGYRVQCLHEMGVSGRDSMDLICLDVIAWEPRVYRLMFDSSAWDWLTSVEDEFWKRVLAREPVGPEWDEQFAEQAARVIVKGKLVELGPDVSALIERRKEFAAIKKEAEEEYERLGLLLADRLGDAEKAVAPGWKLGWVNMPETVVESFTRKASRHIRAYPIKQKGIKQ